MSGDFFIVQYSLTKKSLRAKIKSLKKNSQHGRAIRRFDSTTLAPCCQSRKAVNIMEAYGRVYLIWCTDNGKRYVGKTTKTLKERMNRHLSGNLYVDRAIRHHGIENFRYGVIKTCASKAELDECERHFIAVLKSKAPYGYNLTDGGDGGVGVERTSETCAKISAALKGKPKSPEHRAKISATLATHTGEKNSFFGRHHTEESKAKMRAAQTGKKHTAETRAKMSATRKGKPKSPETRAKLSMALRGEKNPRYGKRNTVEHQAKIVASHLGKKTPPETCAKIAAALRGNPFTLERCANISAANRTYSPYKNLLAELEARQMSYAALARLLGLSAGKVSMRMRCERNFTARDKAKLVEIFGKPIEYLLARDE